MSSSKEMPFLDHLEELRWHIIRSFVVIFISMITAFAAGPWIFEHIIFAPSKSDFLTFRWLCALSNLLDMQETLCIKASPFKIQSRLMTGQFSMHLIASLVIGFIISFPYVFWEFWRFISPGLYNTEKKVSRWAVFSVSSLFGVGVAFGYFVMSPLAIWFLSSYSISEVISNEFDITSYVSTVVVLVLGSGLLFQMPVIAYFLTKIGIANPHLMKKYRRHAFVIILIASAIITPPDPMSQSLIAIPLYLLYEVSILISRMVSQKRQNTLPTKTT